MSDDRPDAHERSAPLKTPARLAWSALVFGVSGLIQAVGGFWTGSLGLVSDSLENLNDMLANLMGLASLLVANRREPNERYAYGLHRLEVFNTLMGGGLLLALALGIVVEALHRLKSPQTIQTGWVIAFSCAGLTLNVLATLLLRPKDPRQLERDSSLKSAYLHAFSDSIASIALVASMVAIRLTGWRWLDPLVALGIVLLILRGAFELLRDAFGILMHRAAFDPGKAKARLLTLPGVLGVEDLRSWRVCSHLVVCTAHVQVQAERIEETESTLKAVEQLLADEFEVRHVTVHFETPAMASHHHHQFLHRHEAGEHNH